MLQKTIKKERRRFIRANRILTIKHRLYKRKSSVFDEAWQVSTTNNMSIAGLLFSSVYPYRIEDILQLYVVMSGALDVFRGFGRVVRVEQKKSDYRIAIAFVEENSKLIKGVRSIKKY